MENERKRKSFFQKKDRPDLMPEDTSPTLAYFFKLLGRKAGKLLSLNLLMVLQVLPLVIAVFVYMMGAKTPTVESPMYAPLLGTYIAGGSPIAGTLLGLFGRQLDIPVMTTGRLIVILCLVGFTLLTWGWQNVGAVYNLRSMVRGDSCFLWSDFFYAIRRNLVQGFLFGIIDFIIIGLLGFNIYFYFTLSTEFSYGVMYAISIALAVFYICMRTYIYPMMITFDLSIYKLLKNGLIFTLLGIKRNIMMLLGMLLVVVITLALVFGGLASGLSFTLILPFFYFLPLVGFIGIYAAYPNIKRYMIDPYEQPEDTVEED
ncbi:MAG: hypothetical protein E7644_04225 [Ruminococcaceae bacterium]|nr:hypothetical protein [Oscillospiraceae bacterium]